MVLMSKTLILIWNNLRSRSMLVCKMLLLRLNILFWSWWGFAARLLLRLWCLLIIRILWVSMLLASILLRTMFMMMLMTWIMFLLATHLLLLLIVWLVMMITNNVTLILSVINRKICIFIKISNLIYYHWLIVMINSLWVRYQYW